MKEIFNLNVTAIGPSEVHINGNITAEANSNDITLECSFSLRDGDAFYSTALTAENATTDKFIEIAGYLRNSKPLFTPFGMDLFGNAISLINFDETRNMFKLAFDNVTCRHERRYKCLLLVTSSSSVLPRVFESEAIWISVTGEDAISSIDPKQNSLSGGDSVQLLCKANGNPKPSYSWTKDNSSGEIIGDNDTLSISKANISDTGLYTCDTRNVVDGNIYSEWISTYINIGKNGNIELDEINIFLR
ncbi:CNTN3 [Mytilus edulis]|uniref:CNTN3 n=1 Tax=Mytilus edulis TaxID=6550 RepID=A0A8S3SV85_MYTED|nr:CNTN3 [Mytilus edulis]